MLKLSTIYPFIAEKFAKTIGIIPIDSFDYLSHNQICEILRILLKSLRRYYDIDTVIGIYRQIIVHIFKFIQSNGVDDLGDNQNCDNGQPSILFNGTGFSLEISRFENNIQYFKLYFDNRGFNECVCEESQEVLLSTNNGYCIRFRIDIPDPNQKIIKLANLKYWFKEFSTLIYDFGKDWLEIKYFIFKNNNAEQRSKRA